MASRIIRRLGAGRKAQSRKPGASVDAGIVAIAHQRDAIDPAGPLPEEPFEILPDMADFRYPLTDA